MSGVAGLLLAAGAGRRFGMPKALVECDGRLLVERAVNVLRSGGCAPVVVVLGAAAAEVRRLARLGDAVLVDNPDWPTGMGSSLRAGLAALADGDARAVVVLPVDMPGVTAEAVRRVAAFARPDALAAATYGGVRGHPVLLGRDHWPGVALAARGDVGARDYLRERQVRPVRCDEVASGEDFDLPGDVAAGNVSRRGSPKWGIARGECGRGDPG
ncbi:nicotine blue oxidoreductase [Streptoalloteichus tenebrarius]|uniref:Nicotine blue oxidoreductase n=1 Tax=Streptoalloteichus tenebrarius (strain ATCC 17920 / DSM 40477 / JCM 4838 / CBS 697.72 / NBRC 16177 / NCIMB 11028 / NRRL B-12390 / A12253. 1 / ISP 5477) TaxID=1933 RepID=A0ABT1I207_STRSD|nr:nucleotidyltransferase family protein [Streptoalloteichus tenebrarius]MCP2261761.1 nicotine blue oxidoreductase [Streptoalloteichus tenebrarius]BFF00817.1 nucleotidyltransferase family protein [Streptoalloteichus tenebrarius]